MVKSLFVAALVAGGVAVPVGTAQAHPGGGEGGPPASPTEMAQMHELMDADNPGMAQMCERIRQGAPERA